MRSPAAIFARMALDHPGYVPKSARPMKFFLVTVTKWCPVLRRGTTVAMAEAKPGAATAHDPRITRYGPSAGTDARDCIHGPCRDEGVTPSTAWPRTGRSADKTWTHQHVWWRRHSWRYGAHCVEAVTAGRLRFVTDMACGMVRYRRAACVGARSWRGPVMAPAFGVPAVPGGAGC